MLTFTMNAQNLSSTLKKAKNKVGLSQEVSISEEEIGEGLKQALAEGVDKAVMELSSEDGYFDSPYKVLLPDNAKKITDKLKVVPGFKNGEEKLILKLNRAAELAAEKAGPIFFKAIKGMNITEAMQILKGEEDEATRYLENNTHGELYKEFLPVIKNALDEVHARQYWRSLTTAYNQLPMVKKVNPELDDHVCKSALYGLFSLIEKKENDIRSNTKARSSELLKRVFALQD